MINYPRHSPSSLNLFTADTAMFVLERVLGRQRPSNAIMLRGKAVESGVAHGLLFPDAPLGDCCDIAFTEYDYATAVLGDARVDKCREAIPEMVEQSLAELRKYGVPSSTQGFIEWQPFETLLPIVGYYDFKWNEKRLIVDLKTTEKMPSSPRTSHAMQVAMYTEGDWRGMLTYVTPKKIQSYELEEKEIEQCRNSLVKIARSVENFLAQSNDPDFFISITAPSFDSYYWGSPETRQIAHEVWGI